MAKLSKPEQAQPANLTPNQMKAAIPKLRPELVNEDETPPATI